MEIMRLLRALDETFPLPKLEERRHYATIDRFTGWLQLFILLDGKYQRVRLTSQEATVLTEKEACVKILSLFQREGLVKTA